MKKGGHKVVRIVKICIQISKVGLRSKTEKSARHNPVITNVSLKLKIRLVKILDFITATDSTIKIYSSLYDIINLKMKIWIAKGLRSKSPEVKKGANKNKITLI